MKRIFSVLLALVLVAGAAPARCAGGPGVVLRTGQRAGEVRLSLEDLDGGAVYGVQVELTLAGEYPRCAFLPGSASAYSPGCWAEVRQGRTVVTVYLTDRAPLTQGKTLDVGTLDVGTAELVAWDALPETAEVVVLDQDLRPMERSGTWPVTATAPAQPDPPAGPGGSGDSGNSGKPGAPADPEPTLPAQPDTAAPPFQDVQRGMWFYDAVAYVYSREIMSGTAEDLFSPGLTARRGMVVTMLHRMEGYPAALPAGFQDVPAGAYYAGAVDWAASSGVVTGTGENRFSPDNPVTREQLAAILYRFADYKKLDVDARADLSGFPDAGQVSGYARDAMAWAVASGLINGVDGYLDPGGQATRAQLAVIFQRLCVNLLRLS